MLLHVIWFPLILKSYDSRSGFTNTDLVLKEIHQYGGVLNYYSEWTERCYSGSQCKIADVTWNDNIFKYLAKQSVASLTFASLL